MNITKILFSVMAGVIITTPTLATKTMCITNDNNSIILDPSIEGTNPEWDEPSKIWSLTYQNNTLSGEARCTDILGSSGIAYPSYNFENYPVGSAAANENYISCWCKMTRPVRSAWVFAANWSDRATVCAQSCAGVCAMWISTNKNGLASGVYGSAGM